MVMKFKFKHVLSYDNKQFYKLTSFDCLPASKLPLKYINGSGPKVFRNDRSEVLNYGTDVLYSLSIGEHISDTDMMDFYDIVEAAGHRLADIKELDAYLKEWADGYTNVKF